MSLDIGPKTTIEELLRSHPHLLDVLAAQSPLFDKLRNPLLRKTMGKLATLEKAAGIGGLDLDALLATLRAAADRPEEGAGERREAVKAILRDLHAGMTMEEAKERFREVVSGVSAAEIAAIEQSLMDEGLPADEIKDLCEVHVEIFKEALEERDPPQVPPGHPVHTYMKENRALESIASQVSLAIGRLGTPAASLQEVEDLLQRLEQVNVHYTRKENQLFPMLEAHHFTGPSQVMWSIHDDVRGLLKQAREAARQGDHAALGDSLQKATRACRDMIYKEEHILFPASLDMLTEAEWVRMKAGEADVGFAWVEPDAGWPDRDLAAPPGSVPQPEAPAGETVEGLLRLDTGRLALEQINLFLKHLPVDVTFVDENDRVAYYSEGPERIFPRSPAIIGREVRNCHPPKSVHVVNMILDAFKSGARNTAEFWLELGGRFLHIRYFAVRDGGGSYRGTLEVSQDVTGIRALEGEQRLLDWE